MSHYDISKEQLTARFEANRAENAAKRKPFDGECESVEEWIARGNKVKVLVGVKIDKNYKPLGLPTEYELGD